jgi:formyltetrahydrofolate-dependent phosphoribosylglycinamide formyltransferase
MATRLGVLLSGSGRTLENFFDHIRDGKLDAEVAVVIGTNAEVYGLVRADNHGVPQAVVNPSDYRDTDAFSGALCEALDPCDVDLVCLAGFMFFWKIPPEYRGRVINIHPALIPAFCGKGMYGHHVHEAVINYGAKVSGCTVHFADNIYDHGPIILQRVVDVSEDETPDSLAAKVFEQECIAYPQAIQLFGEGRLKIEGRRVRILNGPSMLP